MKHVGAWSLFLALTAGVLLRLEVTFQPFRLKGLTLENFTPELETQLRTWANSFALFHPAWIVKRQPLNDIEHLYPVNVHVKWHPIDGTLTITGTPLIPLMKIRWRNLNYCLSANGNFWPDDLLGHALKVSIPTLPMIKLGDSFPLLGDSSGTGRIIKIRVKPDWFLNILQHLNSASHLNITDVELRRRGGEDVVACTIELKKTGRKSRFLSLVENLDNGLAIAEEILSGQVKANENNVIDATYIDKVVVRSGTS